MKMFVERTKIPPEELRARCREEIKAGRSVTALLHTLRGEERRSICSERLVRVWDLELVRLQEDGDL